MPISQSLSLHCYTQGDPSKALMIISQALAGVKLGVVESVIFAGISLAAIAFSVLLFRNIAE
jgi:hypothetical protein